MTGDFSFLYIKLYCSAQNVYDKTGDQPVDPGKCFPCILCVLLGLFN